MNFNEGVPLKDEEEVEMKISKQEEEKQLVENDDEEFDKPIKTTPKQTEIIKKAEIPYFLNKIVIPDLKVNKMI